MANRSFAGDTRYIIIYTYKYPKPCNFIDYFNRIFPTFLCNFWNIPNNQVLVYNVGVCWFCKQCTHIQCSCSWAKKKEEMTTIYLCFMKTHLLDFDRFCEIVRCFRCSLRTVFVYLYILRHLALNTVVKL